MRFVKQSSLYQEFDVAGRVSVNKSVKLKTKQKKTKQSNIGPQEVESSLGTVKTREVAHPQAQENNHG